MKSLNAYLLTAIVVFGLMAGSLQAETFIVTRTNISGPGSLPAIISQANATPGDNTIEFARLTNPITLLTPLPTVTNNVVISGPTDVPTVISGGGLVSIFSFTSGTTNVLSNLILADGTTSGGGAAINNAGTLLLSGCVLSNHTASVYGGAISNAGTMTILASTISGNRSTNSGGAIYNAGTLSILATTFSANLAYGGEGNPASGRGGGGGGGLGGAVFSASGLLSFTNCTFSGNSARGGGGGSGAIGRAFVGYGGDGGGIGAGKGGTNQVGQDGSAEGGGGGGAGEKGGGNGGSLGGGGGGGGGTSNTGSSGGGSGGLGGGDGAGGAFRQEVDGSISLLGGGGGGGAGLGAGLFVQSGSVALVNCTFTSNSAVGGAGGRPNAAGMAGLGQGGGIYNLAGTVFLLNTLVAANSATNGGPDLYGTFNSTGYNLIGNSQGATGLSINDFQMVSPNLGLLEDNGGPTSTCLPLPGSLAVGFGTMLDAPRTDQRGVPRPQGGTPDIGAVEVAATAPVNVGPFRRDSSGFSFSVILDATNSYRLQATINLGSWIDLTNLPNGGSLHFIDVSTTNFSRRFYRAAAP